MSYTVVKVMKSKGIAVLLVMFFGGFGLFYTSITAGLIMGIIAPILAIVIFMSGLASDSHLLMAIPLIFCCLYYLICIIMALIGVKKYNLKIQDEAQYYNSTSDQSSVVDNEKNGEYFSNDPLYINEIMPYKRGVNAWIFPLILLSIFGLLFFLYDSKTNSIKLDKLTTAFSSHSTDKEEIKDQLEEIYTNILNGAYSSSTIAGTSAKGLPFYNTPNITALMAMGFAPLAQVFGTEVNLSPTNINVHDFNDSSNTAKLDYILVYESGNDSGSESISMVVKKINGKWKFDAQKLFATKKDMKSHKSSSNLIKNHSDKATSSIATEEDGLSSAKNEDEGSVDNAETNTFKINKEEYEDGREKEYDALYLFFQSHTISLIEDNSVKIRWTIVSQSSDGEYDVFKLFNGDKIYKKGYDISLLQKDNNSTIHYYVQPAKNNQFL